MAKTVFKSEYAIKIIDFIKEKYKIDAEYLWQKFPNNAVFRNKKNKKWFAAILTTDLNRFFEGKKGEIEVINLKMEPEKLLMLVDNKSYFSAYHMNKKHWYTILLDKSVKIDEIFSCIEESYNLIANK